MKTVMLKLTERELWLLKNGFDASYEDDGSVDGLELARVGRKVNEAWEKARPALTNADKAGASRG